MLRPPVNVIVYVHTFYVSWDFNWFCILHWQTSDRCSNKLCTKKNKNIQKQLKSNR